jgi:hypothetical protein
MEAAIDWLDPAALQLPFGFTPRMEHLRERRIAPEALVADRRQGIMHTRRGLD